MLESIGVEFDFLDRKEVVGQRRWRFGVGWDKCGSVGM